MGIAGAWLATPGIASDSATYFHFDVGPNFLQKTRQTFSDGFERDLKWDMGFRVSIAQGFNLTSWAAIELETGFLYNEWEDNDDEWVGNVPILANAVFKYEIGRVTPFIGVGGGGSIFLAKTAFFQNDSDYYLVAAWQGQAGLRYNIGQDLAIGVVYKYLGTTNPEFELFDSTFKFHNVRNHYVGVQLHYNF